MNTIYLRREKPEDFDGITTLLKAAFKDDLHSDQTEHLLVERLRKSPFYIPELAIVAEKDAEIIGYILLTKITIDKREEKVPALALAPVAVLPTYQNLGLGSALIHYAHAEAKKLSHKIIALLGHEKYYPRFGYKIAREFDIDFSIPAPDKNCMLLELEPGALLGVNGTVTYPRAFFE